MDTTGQSKAGETDHSREELLTELEVLREENRALRESYAQAKRAQYHRTAIGLGIVGVVAVIGGILVSTASGVLFALGGIGIFGGILTYYLTPERFISADIGSDIYTSLAGNESALVEELGLSGTRIYLPTSGQQARLYIPHDPNASLPATEALDHVVVVTDDGATRGLAFEPSGQRLFSSFVEAVTGSVESTPGNLAEQLTDALVEQFELVQSATVDVDTDHPRLTVAVTGSAYGPVDQIDHPVASFLAVGLATGLEEPVSVEVTTADSDQYLITCRWNVH